jgi:hypothetical protein
LKSFYQRFSGKGIARKESLPLVFPSKTAIYGGSHKAAWEDLNSLSQANKDIIFSHSSARFRETGEL